MQEIEICQTSGLLASEHCPKQRRSFAPAELEFPLQKCSWHSEVYTDLAEKNRVCSSCWTVGQYKKSVRLILPPDLNSFLHRNGRLAYSPLPHKKDCPDLLGSTPLAILYPASDNSSLVVPRDFLGQYQKVVFQAAHQRQGSRLWWYLNGNYLQETKGRHEIAFVPPAGRHELLLVDDEGFKEKRIFTVYRR